jgi:magnesium transporter
MLIVYVLDQKKLRKEEAPFALPDNPVWIDLLNPTKEEEVLVEQALRVDLPTREEMKEIEVSSRLYKESDALFMTATVLSNAASELPEALPVTFVLTSQCLITIRYSDPKSFQVYSAKVQQRIEGDISKETVLASLLESVVNRLADALEVIAMNVNSLSQEIFVQKKDRASDSTRNFHDILSLIAQKGDLNSKIGESLVGFGRLLTFLAQNLESSTAVGQELKGWITTLNYDINALTGHVSFISNKISFLLEATLGMIGIEQNATIKIFSVAAVIFLPPTLVASVYGMNFEFMPELKWFDGYPFALGLMVLSAVIPYWYFKRRGWL